MCGISGFNWGDEERLKAMMKELANRGPDDSGTHIDEMVSLGHNRLSIIDLSSAGHQPMFDPTREFVIIYNGELYNFKDIKEELKVKGYEFNTHTDTEVILYSYKEWGPECLKKFNGMFAFVIYDILKKEMFLARDHVGIKPLYYFHDKERFIFSSTIPSFFIHGIKKIPNRKVIRDFLLYNNTDHLDETFFVNIMKFPKGHYAIYKIEDNSIEFTKWWENRFTGDFKGTYEEAVAELKRLMIKSVDRHLISDVPVGTCLSGGIDSSAVACLIDKSEIAEIETFSAVLPGFSKDESKYMDIITSETGMENHKVALSADDIKEDIQSFIKIMEEPVPGSSPYAQYRVFQLAKDKEFTVLLDGQGADELFAGYHYFFGFYIKGLKKQGKTARARMERAAIKQNADGDIGMKSIDFLSVPTSVQRKYFASRSNISRTLLKDETAMTSFFDDYYGINSLHDALKFHLDHKLEHLLKWEDRNSMAHSREGRVPFLDVDIMKFVFTLPEEFLISDGRTKNILRDAMRGIVPDKILDRQDKIGFATPEDDWLRDKELKHLLDMLLEEDPLCIEYIDLKKTRKMINSHLSGKKNYGRQIWKTIFLELWMRMNFTGGAA